MKSKQFGAYVLGQVARDEELSTSLEQLHRATGMARVEILRRFIIHCLKDPKTALGVPVLRDWRTR